MSLNFKNFRAKIILKKKKRIYNCKNFKMKPNRSITDHSNNKFKVRSSNSIKRAFSTLTVTNLPDQHVTFRETLTAKFPNVRVNQNPLPTIFIIANGNRTRRRRIENGNKYATRFAPNDIPAYFACIQKTSNDSILSEIA